jgi:hypothetical protein
MERDPFEGGSDVGRDVARDLGDEPAPLYRDAAPDVLAPIDESAPVSGHTPPPEPTGSAVDRPSGLPARRASRSRRSTARP